MVIKDLKNIIDFKFRTDNSNILIWINGHKDLFLKCLILIYFGKILQKLKKFWFPFRKQ